jgi:hypothetical protein
LLTADMILKAKTDGNIDEVLTRAMAKKRFSELSGEAACNQEYTGGLKQ